jgi:hypothetical protein
VDEEEGRVMVMNRKVEEANVLRILQRRLAQVAEERQVPTEIPRVPDLNQPTLLLAKVYPNCLKKKSQLCKFFKALK